MAKCCMLPEPPFLWSSWKTASDEGARDLVDDAVVKWW